MSEQEFIARWKNWKSNQKQGLEKGARVLLIPTMGLGTSGTWWAIPIDMGAYPDKPAFVASDDGEWKNIGHNEEGSPYWNHHFFSLMPAQIGQPAFLLNKGDAVVALSPMRQAYCERGEVIISCSSNVPYAEYYISGSGGETSYAIENIESKERAEAFVQSIREEYNDAVSTMRAVFQTCSNLASYNVAATSHVLTCWSHLDNGVMTEEYHANIDRRFNACSEVLNRKLTEDEFNNQTYVYEAQFAVSDYGFGSILQDKDGKPIINGDGEYSYSNYHVHVNPWHCSFRWPFHANTVTKAAYVFNYSVPDPEKIKRILFEFCLTDCKNKRPPIHVSLGRGIVDFDAPADEQAVRIADIEKRGIKGSIDEETIIQPAEGFQEASRRIVVSFDRIHYSEHDVSEAGSRDVEDYNDDGIEEPLIRFDENIGVFSIVITGEPEIHASYEKDSQPWRDTDKEFQLTAKTVFFDSGFLYDLNYPIMIPVYARSGAGVELGDDKEEDAEGGDNIGEE